ncbi:putative baseplate assembly protein [Paenibacillus contaminans]|uniref:Putative baseplate assembly protein n=1 Tax=Paenibacillus contaminans TaxID=450362 RepID=A0A329LU37_9BACL|nr:putative baseplate assembly protein [Paenibacillus contaminans]RAV11471.1 putative baseplate assembly protein [Paenibacillus contaminans]
MKAPIMDARDIDAIVKEMLELAPYYTPEWLPATNQDSGTALMNIFARMYAGIIQRLNRVPDKNFIAFLNMLGMKLQPASQARGPVTFELSAGARDPVLIPARTQIAAPASNGGSPIVFETERPIMATPAKPTEAFTYMPSANMITQAPSGLWDGKASEPFELFAETDLQEHAIYLGHNDLFNVISDVRIRLNFVGRTLTDRQLELLAELDWQYATADEWLPFDAVRKENYIDLEKKAGTPLTLNEVNGIKSRWIRGIVKPGQIEEAEDVLLDSLHFSVEKLTPLPPDLAFYNNIPLNLSEDPIYPFGTTPRTYDTFYLANQEALSKKGATVTLSFRVQSDIYNDALVKLSWEYWDGRGWVSLRVVDNKINDSVRTIQFKNQTNIAETTVNGQPNYWIRCRIVSGDYGREKYTPSDGNIDRTSILEPQLKSIGFTYTSNDKSNAQYIFTHNNLDFQERTTDWANGKMAQPFYKRADAYQCLYIGFDKPPLKGPISMYVNLQDQAYTEAAFPRLEWEYYRNNQVHQGWARLDVSDDTQHMTQSGCVAFIGQNDFSASVQFGKSLYWIRAIDVEDRYRSADPLGTALRINRKIRIIQAAAEKEGRGEDCTCGPAPCSDFTLFDPRFPHNANTNLAPSPKMNGIHINTVMTAHAESITAERLGSSSGNASQTFSFSKFPVLTEDIFVDELRTLTEEERKSLRDDPAAQVRETKDEAGNTTAFWVRWTPIEHIQDSTPNGRHYEIDRTFGSIQFGDDNHGKIPSIGSDNIKADYAAGGGTAGNIGANEIKIMRTSIAYVDRASNPYPFGGGFDTELLEQALERGPRSFRIRNRAVSASDYEHLTLQAAQGITKVKCLPNFNDRGEHESGWVTVILVPQGAEAKPSPSPQLRRQVEAYLRERAPSVISSPRHIKALGPLYAEVSVSARLVVSSFDDVPIVSQSAHRTVSEYLHPLTGGKDGRGWEFGKLPCLSDFYTLFEADRNVDHVEELSMTIRDAVTGTSISVTPETSMDIRTVPYLLIYSGEHKLTVTSLPVTGAR